MHLLGGCSVSACCQQTFLGRWCEGAGPLSSFLWAAQPKLRGVCTWAGGGAGCCATSGIPSCTSAPDMVVCCGAHAECDGAGRRPPLPSPVPFVPGGGAWLQRKGSERVSVCLWDAVSSSSHPGLLPEGNGEKQPSSTGFLLWGGTRAEFEKWLNMITNRSRLPAKIKISSLISLFPFRAFQHIKCIETIFNITCYRSGPDVCLQVTCAQDVVQGMWTTEWRNSGIDGFLLLWWPEEPHCWVCSWNCHVIMSDAILTNRWKIAVSLTNGTVF